MSAVVGSQYGATTGAAESLIAQLHSQGKLTTQRRDNRQVYIKKLLVQVLYTGTIEHVFFV
jgi:hypothetical protein